MLVNVTLVRRRLRDKQLRYEIMRVGQRTQTDVCIAYIDDIVDQEMLESIRDKIKQVKIDGLPLADKQLEEATVKRGWNPFPLVRYSERPDTVAVHLWKAMSRVFVDTTPSVMILPTTYFDLTAACGREPPDAVHRHLLALGAVLSASFARCFCCRSGFCSH